MGNKKNKTEQGACPKCKGKSLTYSTIELNDQSIGYPYTCDDCKFEGVEWYTLVFDYHMGKDNNIY